MLEGRGFRTRNRPEALLAQRIAADNARFAQLEPAAAGRTVGWDAPPNEVAKCNFAVIAVVGNELVDRDVAGDKNGHPVGDVVIAIVLVGIVFYVSGFVARRRSRQAP